MEVNEERNLVFRIIKFGLANEVFTLQQLQRDLQLDEKTMDYIFNNLYSLNDNHTINTLISSVHQFSRSTDPRNRAMTHDSRLLPNAMFQYIDYLEIVAARGAAQESKKLAWFAIWISTGIGLVGLLVAGMQLYFQLGSN